MTSSLGDLVTGNGRRGGTPLSYAAYTLLKIGLLLPYLSGLTNSRTGVYAKLKGEEVILGGQGRETVVTILFKRQRNKPIQVLGEATWSGK